MYFFFVGCKKVLDLIIRRVNSNLNFYILFTILTEIIIEIDSILIRFYATDDLVWLT